MTNEITLDDLVNLSGLTLRTIRFYIQEGLLDGPDTRGRFSQYSQRHLDRLEVIKRLKSLRLPLHEIRGLLESMTPDEINKIYSEQDIPSPYHLQTNQQSSKPVLESSVGLKALQYIRDLELAQKNIQMMSDASGTENQSAEIQKDDASKNERNIIHKQTEGEQQNWRRIIVREGVEVHLHENILLVDDLKIKKMVAYLDKLFGDKP